MLTKAEKEALYLKSMGNVKLYLSGSVTDEDIFWLRINVGEEFIQRHFPKSFKSTIQSKGFWNFWRQIWHMNDKAFLKVVLEGNYSMNAIPLDVYEEFHQQKALKYSLSKKVHDALVREVVTNSTNEPIEY